MIQCCETDVSPASDSALRHYWSTHIESFSSLALPVIVAFVKLMNSPRPMDHAHKQKQIFADNH